jgi:hypothetical protein
MSLTETFRRLLAGRAIDRSAGWFAALVRDLSVWSDIRAFPSLAVWGGVHCVAAMLLARRLTDASSIKFTPTQLCFTATVAALLVVTARAMLARVEKQPPASWLRLFAGFVSAAPIVTLFFGSARRLPLSTATYLGAVTFFVGVATWCWNREFIERLLLSFLLSPPERASAAVRPRFTGDAGSRTDRTQERDPSETLRLKRSVAPGGSDRLEGAIIAEFAHGQIVTTLHIPFLPTFPRPPELVCEIDEQAPVRIKGTAVYPYGCRVELKRVGDSSKPARFELRFSATLCLSTRRAA